ncbi:hypothetical protein [Chryseobacterium hagamense]|nr:hypothetical protein [Chryseobacterium hagamense]
MKKAARYVLIIISGCFLLAIGNYFLVWKRVEIDSALSAKPLFKDFTHQKQESFDGRESESIKTNNFRIKTDGSSAEAYRYEIQDFPVFLQIRFSTGDGYSGGGYVVKIIKNRYRISPYHYTDSPRPFDFLHEDYYKILSSKVILDKASYRKGDPIFGYTEFEVQKRYGPDKYFERGKGYFSGIVR